jgi:hypothetical protein
MVTPVIRSLPAAGTTASAAGPPEAETPVPTATPTAVDPVFGIPEKRR